MSERTGMVALYFPGEKKHVRPDVPIYKTEYRRGGRTGGETRFVETNGNSDTVYLRLDVPYEKIFQNSEEYCEQRAQAGFVV